MAASLNRVFLIGRLGADPEMRYTPSGTPLVRMRLAVNRPPARGEGGERGAEQEPDWFTVKAWNQLAENCAQYLTKGRLVFVEGRLAIDTWQGQDGQKRTSYEIVARDVQFLESRQSVANAAPGDREPFEPDDKPVGVDDIPF